MDTDDVEVLTVNALGGTDLVTVNDLAATETTNVTSLESAAQATGRSTR